MRIRIVLVCIRHYESPCLTPNQWRASPMVASKQQFPLVRWAVLVCSHDDLGTRDATTIEERNPAYVTVTPCRSCAVPFYFCRNDPGLRTVVLVFRGKETTMTNQDQPG